MKVTVDFDKCQGHGQCFANAPDLYPLDDSGYVAITELDVPPGKEADAQAGVDACPAQALTASK